MKSVTIRDAAGALLLKVIHRESGAYEIVKRPGMAHLDIEVRDDTNHKVLFGEPE